MDIFEGEFWEEKWVNVVIIPGLQGAENVNDFQMCNVLPLPPLQTNPMQEGIQNILVGYLLKHFFVCSKLSSLISKIGIPISKLQKLTQNLTRAIFHATNLANANYC